MPCFSGLVVPRAAIRHARCRRGKRAQRRGAQGAAQRIARHDATVAAQVAGPQAAAQGPASMGRGENSKYSLSVGVWSCRDNWDLRFITPVTNQESLYNPMANLSGGGKRGTSGNFIATSHGSFMGKNELSHVTCRFHHEKRCI